MKVVICGDLVPTESNTELFEKAAVEQIIGKELADLLKNSHICLCNLETPAVDTQDPIEKCGPNLITTTASLNALPYMGFNVVNLANNHILDQGDRGVQSTINALEERELSYIGAGMNAASADSCYFYDDGKCKIGIYGVAEHEFSIADEKSAGANPYDPLRTFDRVKDLKRECDYLIVLYHGGIEEYRYPSPNLQRVCRKLVESGADFVVCQHSHCIGCEEEYLGATIVYGQGNFIFDRKDNEFWQNGFVIELEIRSGLTTKKYNPIIKNGSTVKLADNDKGSRITHEFYNRSHMLLQPEFIEKEYESFCAKKIRQYLSCFRGKKTFIQKVLYRVFGERWLFRHYTKSDTIRMRNYLECEAHLEVFSTALKNIKHTEE